MDIERGLGGRTGAWEIVEDFLSPTLPFVFSSSSSSPKSTTEKSVTLQEVSLNSATPVLGTWS